MPVDPNIALSFNPKPLGPNIQLGNALNDVSGFMQLQQQAKAVQSQNALKNILGQPGAVDATGNPTPDAMQKIMAVSPEAGMKLKQNALVSQEHQLRLGTMKTKAFGDQMDMMATEYTPVQQAYEGALKEGKTPEQAAVVAQGVLDGANKRLSDGGFLSPTQQQNLPTKYDPIKFPQAIQGFSSYQDWRKQQGAADEKKKADDLAARTQSERERHYQAMENKESQSPAAQTQKNINAIAEDQIKKAETARGGPLTDAEKAQIKLSAGDTAAAAKHAAQNAPLSVSDDELKAYGAQAVKGEPLNQIAPGYRQDATALRQKIHAEAIKQIRAENQNMTPEQAGEELALRTVEYQSSKRSSGQLTTMLGATRQATGQLDYNIDQVREDLKKLPSSDMSPIINAIVRGEEKWSGDPAYSALFYHMHATAVESARILSGGQASTAQLHQGAMEEAQKWANVNMTPESFDAVAEAMKEEGQARIGTYEQALKAQERRSSDRTNTTAPAGTGDQKTPAPSSLPPKLAALSEKDRVSAISDLKADPVGAAAEFDHAFGEGAAAKVLGGNESPARATTAPAPAAPAAAQQGNGKTVQSPISVPTLEKAMALPPGTFFVGPDGQIRQRPPQAAPSAPTN